MSLVRIIVVVVCLLAVKASAELAEGLVSYWPFEDVTAESTPDVVSGNDLFLFKMDHKNLVTGRFGNAFSFDGQSQFLSLNYQQSSKLPIYAEKSYSVALWVKGPPNQAN